MQGWVSFHRQIMKWEWYTDPNTFRLFFHLVLNANHEKGRWKGNDIERGQLITSSDKLAMQLELSRQQIRTSLKKLKSTNEITIKSTNKYTLITVEKYSFYQKKEDEITINSTNNSTNEQPSNNHQITTNNNDNNKNNDNKLNISMVVEEYKKLKLPSVRTITDKRKKSINARINDYGYETVIEVLNKASNSDFLSSSLKSNWYNFDWVFNPNNFVKIIEGKYSGGENNGSYQRSDEGLGEYEGLGIEL